MLIFCIFESDKSNLVSMFDRETRREKVLENMAKEARIKQATLTGNGMKSVVNSFKVQSKLLGKGFENIREKAHKKTRQEEEADDLCQEAEINFFKTINEEKERRSQAGKPLHYTE